MDNTDKQWLSDNIDQAAEVLGTNEPLETHILEIFDLLELADEQDSLQGAMYYVLIAADKYSGLDTSDYPERKYVADALTDLADRIKERLPENVKKQLIEANLCVLSANRKNNKYDLSTITQINTLLDSMNK